jgi:hypothetical protein
MSMRGLKAFRSSSKDVEVGQRYRSRDTNFLGRAGDVWLVEALFTASDAMPYAKLAAEADPSLRKTLSIAALIDRRRFLPVIMPKSLPQTERPAGEELHVLRTRVDVRGALGK